MTESDPLAVTLGLEEECFLIDPETRDLVREPDPAFLEECGRTSGAHKVVPELLRCQIETNTRVCHSIAELRQAHRETRRTVVQAAEKFGMAVLATSTHPFATWRDQSITPRQRYEQLTMQMQDVARRFLVGGMHIHAGFGDADQRIRVMTALRQYLPIFNALSASSPFNGGRDTGFKSWRLSTISGLPRTGIPGPLSGMAAYETLLDRYRRMECLADGSELWWDIRPSHAYPTVEIRICDTTPRREEALCIAALYAALIRRLMRLDAENALPEGPPTEIIIENRWLAQRYGILAFLGAEAGGREDIDDSVSRLVDEVAEDAEALDCTRELAGVRQIVLEGAAADRQIDLYRLRRLEGDSEQQALHAVIDLMAGESRAGL